MKTILPQSIHTVDDAQQFLKSLFDNDESYHPEDDAFDIIWKCEQPPNHDEKLKMNQLMNEIYELKDSFDPCDYLCELLNID